MSEQKRPDSPRTLHEAGPSLRLKVSEMTASEAAKFLTDLAKLSAQTDKWMIYTQMVEQFLGDAYVAGGKARGGSQ